MERRKKYHSIENTPEVIYLRYTSEIKTIISDAYTFIENTDKDKLAKFMCGELSLVRFNYYHTDRAFVRSMFETVFRRAQNSNDQLFSNHADEGHKTYLETLNELASRNINFISSLKSEYLNNLKEEVVFPRLVVETDYFLRDFYRPAPQVAAGELRYHRFSKQEKFVKRQLRDLAYNYGAAFTVLTGVLAGYDVKTVLGVFDDKVVRHDLKRSGKSPFVPYSNNGEHQASLTKIKNALVVHYKTGPQSQTDPIVFRSVIQDMVNPFMMIDGMRTEVGKFIQTQENVKALGVFRTVAEMAYRLCPSDFQEPLRTKFIEGEYRNQITSNLVTAYLCIDLENSPREGIYIK